MNLLPAHRYGIFLVVSYVGLLVLVLPVFERWMEIRDELRVIGQRLLSVHRPRLAAA